MKILSVTNLRRVSPEAIDMTLEIEGIGIVEFTAASYDTEQHGRDLFALAESGQFGEINEA